MTNEKEAVSNAMQEARRERTSKAVAAEVPFNLDSVLAMLHQHGAVGAGEASSRAAGRETGATGNPQEQPADPSDNVEDEGFGDEDEGVASRLASLGGKKMASLAKTGSRAVAKPAAKVVAKAVPKTTQAVPKITPAVPAGTVQPAAPVPKPSPSAKPSNQERRACWPSRVCLRWQFDSRLGLLCWGSKLSVTSGNTLGVGVVVAERRKNLSIWQPQQQ